MSSYGGSGAVVGDRSVCTSSVTSESSMPIRWMREGRSDEAEERGEVHVVGPPWNRASAGGEYRRDSDACRVSRLSFTAVRRPGELAFG